MPTVYIAPTAQGSADGTSEANAYAIGSIATAESDAGSGGTIYFLDGTYTNIGTWDADGVTYESLNLHGAEITGTQPNFGSASASVTIKKFKITPSSSERFLVYGASSVIDQIFLTATSSFGYWVQTQGVKFNNSLIVSNNCSGIGRDNQKLSEFKGNTFVVTGIDGNSSGSLSFSAGSAPPAKNCIFISDDTADNVISASIASSSTNCCFHRFGTNNASGGTNNVFSDPLLVDFTNGDYRLRPSSPCINAATAS